MSKNMTHINEWRTARKILCIRFDALCDVLMTTPALRAIKESHDDIHITLLTSSTGARIAPLIPEVDKIIGYDPPWLRPTSREHIFDLQQMVKRLAYSSFDAAVIFTSFDQNPLPAAMLASMAEIPLRLAYCRENPYQLLTDWQQELDDLHTSHIRHEVMRQLDLVASVGFRTNNLQLSVNVDEKAVKVALHKLKRIGLNPEQPWLVIHPGATDPSRRYPKEQYARVAQKLISEYGFQILFSGTRPELELVRSIRSTLKHASFSLVGDLEIDAFAALIRLAPVLISNNTAPVHIAAALGTPVVDIYALTHPQHTPWFVPNRTLSYDVPCRNCLQSVCVAGHHHCLKLISPDEVVEAAVSLFIENKMSRKLMFENANDEFNFGQEISYDPTRSM